MIGFELKVIILSAVIENIYSLGDHSFFFKYEQCCELHTIECEILVYLFSQTES
jgi:hypothetical protein